MKDSVEIQLSKPLGLATKVYIHELARKIPDYYHPVNTQINGKDSLGREIKVNTLGRWMFGVPGYDGAARIIPNGTKVSIQFPYGATEFVSEFMNLLKLKVEAAQGVKNG